MSPSEALTIVGDTSSLKRRGVDSNLFLKNTLSSIFLKFLPLGQIAR